MIHRPTLEYSRFSGSSSSSSSPPPTLAPDPLSDVCTQFSGLSLPLPLLSSVYWFSYPHDGSSLWSLFFHPLLVALFTRWHAGVNWWTTFDDEIKRGEKRGAKKSFFNYGTFSCSMTSIIRSGSLDSVKFYTSKFRLFEDIFSLKTLFCVFLSRYLKAVLSTRILIIFFLYFENARVRKKIKEIKNYNNK